jgi:hypothetical protein
MNRGTIIAIVSAAAGVLVAGSIASVAVINAASGTAAAESIAVTAVADSVANPLPPVPQADTPAPRADTPAPQADTPAPEPRAISAADAATVVLTASGGNATEAQRVTHGGYDAWAITVTRADGSVVRGFVEATSGVIFDWNVVSGPTKATPSKSNGYESEENESDEHESDEHESDEHESDEHESDEHEGGDDD